MSYNEISDLFDVGFLEHLQVLDLEGNQVKTIDQIGYLKRCKNLESVNLINNPVQDEGAIYLQKIFEFAPNLKELDDQDVLQEGYFEKKIEELKNKRLKKTVLGKEISKKRIKESEYALKFKQLNLVTYGQILRLCNQDINLIEQDIREEDVLRDHILN